MYAFRFFINVFLVPIVLLSAVFFICFLLLFIYLRYLFIYAIYSSLFFKSELKYSEDDMIQHDNINKNPPCFLLNKQILISSIFDLKELLE